MAAPTRPTPGDARIPCPLCGGLIHPIAGRCKHCKQDLSALRGARPAAASALPPLVAQPPAPAAAPPMPAPPAQAPAASNGHYAPNGHSPYAPQPPAAAPVANGVHDAASAILPPRPTGRMVTAPPVPGWWKSWPMIVIVLAGIAIVIAVVLMVWPPGSSDQGARTVEPPPAPERMNTNPLPPKSSSIDPAPQPKPADPTAPARPKIDIPDDPDPPVGATQVAILDHVCDRLMVCGNDAAETFCDTAKELTRVLGKRPGPPTCDAGRRCIQRIDRVDCAASAVDVQRLMTDPDCAEALTRC